MKVISFLGTTNYSVTTYQWGEKTCETQFFPAAVAHFFSPTTILICATPTVQQHENLRQLMAHLHNVAVNYEVVPIPEGHSETDLWDIFGALTASVEEGEKVVFDVTHSFRSLPILAFLAVAYLKATKRVVVERVLYGAWEARSATNISPVFDLTPFVALLDWLNAANQFLETGNAAKLAFQLRQTSQPNLESLAQYTTKMSNGLDLLRPRDVAEMADHLHNAFGALVEPLPKPFEVVRDKLREAYSQFRLDAAADSQAYLVSQLRMIEWYVEKQKYVHALSLAREWLVSLLCHQFQLDMWDEKQRAECELLLNGGVRKNEAGEVPYESPYLDLWQKNPYRKRVQTLWGGEPYKLANLRNDVLHSGFRKKHHSADEIINQANAIVSEIRAIAEQFGVLPT